jgi:GlpG protein
MRAIGTVANEQDARRLGAHLLTLGIASQMDPAPEGYQVWIRDEDKLQQAKQELVLFLQDPVDPRYNAAEQLAQQVQQQQVQAEKQYQRNVRDIRSQWRRPSLKSCPFTLGMIVLCVIVAVLTRFGREKDGIVQYLYITQISFRDDGHIQWHPGLPEVRGGQVWRLVTPIFIHLHELHLFFNMWMLYNLGGVIEFQRGKWRLALLVIASAVISNLAQYLFRHPAFGGMSGVVYALFGYAWMKSRFDTSAGLYVSPDTVVMMVAWLFLCMVPGFPIGVANHAHVGGLIVGVVLGYAPTFWRKLRRR